MGQMCPEPKHFGACKQGKVDFLALLLPKVNAACSKLRARNPVDVLAVGMLSCEQDKSCCDPSALDFKLGFGTRHDNLFLVR